MTSVRRPPRWRGSIAAWLIFGAIIVALMAILPIVLAILGGPATPAVTTTAFATAPQGTYAVVARSEEAADVVSVVLASNPSEAMEVGRVPHLPGYASKGNVSPDSRRLALVAADGGSQAHPRSSVLELDLETGTLTRLALDVDYLVTPVWRPDGKAVVATRTLQNEESPFATVTLVAARTDASGEDEVARFEGVLGAYPVGFDPSGELISVVIDGDGSTAYRGTTPVAHLSEHITRDWQLSPDGTQLAFIEANLSNGLRYIAGYAALDAPGRSGSARVMASGRGQQAGVAWKPGESAPIFGREPGSQATLAGAPIRGVTAAGTGIDIPLSYAPDGGFLAVTNLGGRDFANPGRLQLQVIAESGERQTLSGYSRFFGWSAR